MATGREHALPSPANGQVAGTQTIVRALAVLRELRDADGDVGITEIARALELNTSTVHRIVKALVAAGYVAQNDRTERYRLGREAFLLGRAAERTLGFEAAKPLLERLAEITGESVNLVVRDGDEGLVVLREESHQPLRFTQPVGARVPLYCTSTGKILLAFTKDPSAEVTRLGELETLTATTITAPRELLRELEQVKRQGFSVNKGERVPGVCGVAAAVLDADGLASAAVAIQGPEFRMPDERIAELASLAMATAEGIAAAIPHGYHL
jgi:IclR family acetate operon transcriptional repressor